MLLVISVLILIATTFGLNNCNDGGGTNTPNDIDYIESQEWEEIPACIMGIAVDYESHINVTGIEDVQESFTEFTDYAKENDIDVFGYGSNWRYDEAMKQGTYEGVKYWKVTASWFSEDDAAWHQKNVFSVSQTGEVVRLLGCV